MNGSLAFLFRLVSSDRIPPFLFLYAAITTKVLNGLFYKIPFFKHRDERDGRVEKYGIQPWMKFPKSMRFDTKLRKEADRLRKLVGIVYMVCCVCLCVFVYHSLLLRHTLTNQLDSLFSLPHCTQPLVVCFSKQILLSRHVLFPSSLVFDHGLNTNVTLQLQTRLGQINYLS